MLTECSFTAKAKPTGRFGFLSSAKSLVQSVWGKGSSSKAAAMAAAPAAKPVMAKKPSTPISRPSTSVASSKLSASKATNRIPSGGSIMPTTSSRISMLKPIPGGAVSRTQSRSPIPSFGTPITHVSNGGGAEFGSRGSVRNLSLGTKAGSSNRVSSLGVSSKAVTGSMKIKTQVSTENGSIRKFGSTSSRLLAPTASSLAKMHNPNVQSLVSPSKGSSAGIRDQANARADALKTLSQITNVNNLPPPSQIQSPPATKIFSQPLNLIPSPIKPPALSAPLAPGQKPPIPPKPKVMPGRRPRVSRSKVIAKLASQRETPGLGPSMIAPSAGGGRARSSVGAQRRSYGGAKMGRGSVVGDSVMMSAKKRVRQSEFARRRSRAIGESSGSVSHTMEVEV